jgi:hypothetical protein
MEYKMFQASREEMEGYLNVAKDHLMSVLLRRGQISQDTFNEFCNEAAFIIRKPNIFQEIYKRIVGDKNKERIILVSTKDMGNNERAENTKK